ncbi:MAG TPA: hypothetical protein VGF79_11245 [Bacteroidia bacterium]
MQITFKKRQGKKHIITYQREGKDLHWVDADDFLILHDLSHYAIETNLGYTTAFWGMIKSGVDPEQFLVKEVRDRLFVSNEAWYAENMANLVLIEWSQGKFDDFNQVLNEVIQQTDSNLPPIELNEQQIIDIRETYKKLVNQWEMLASDGQMELKF